jgi:hypothetical protein
MIYIQNNNEPCNDILIFPSEFVTDTLYGTVFATRLKTENAKSLWNNNTLHLIIWRRNTLEALKSVHGSGATGSFVWHHASDCSLEDFRGGAEMEWT